MACVADPAVGAVNLGIWQNKKICVKRDGAAAVSAAGVARPSAEAGTCPSGYTKCGTGTYNDNKATCTPTGTACPITDIKIFKTSISDSKWSSVPSGQQITLGPAYASDGTTQEGTYILAYKKAADGSNTLPVAETKIVFDKVCVKGKGSGPTIASARYSGSVSSPSWTNYYSADTCSQTDTRYSQVASNTAKKVVLDNFQSFCGAGGNMTLPGNATGGRRLLADSIPTPTATSMPFPGSHRRVLSNGMELGFSMNSVPHSTTGQHLFGVSTLTNDETNYCSTNDQLCRSIIHRTPCAKMLAYANAAVNDLHDTKMVARSEIFFKIDPGKCATRQQLSNAKPDVDTLKSAVFGQLVTQYIVFFMGILVSCYIIKRDYEGMDIETEEDDRGQRNTHRIANGLDFCAKGIVLLLMILAFTAANKLGASFANVEANGCTDDITEGMGFSRIDKSIKKIQGNTIQNIVILLIGFLYGIYGFYSVQAFNASSLYEKEDASNMEKNDNGDVGIDMESNPESLSDWTRYEDEGSGKPYWSNSKTGETTWDDPANSW